MEKKINEQLREIISDVFKIEVRSDTDMLFMQGYYLQPRDIIYIIFAFAKRNGITMHNVPYWEHERTDLEHLVAYCKRIVVLNAKDSRA